MEIKQETNESWSEARGTVALHLFGIGTEYQNQLSECLSTRWNRYNNFPVQPQDKIFHVGLRGKINEGSKQVGHEVTNNYDRKRHAEFMNNQN